MGIRTSNDPFGSSAVLVDSLIGTAYQTVKEVSENLEKIKYVVDNMQAIVQIAQAEDALDDIVAASPAAVAAAAAATTAANQAVALLNGVLTGLDASHALVTPTGSGVSETLADLATDATTAATLATATATALAVETTTRTTNDATETAARIAAISALNTSLTTAIAGIRPFNVLNYSVAGNGTTDDTAAIQALIDQAEAAGGGTVYFPARTTPYLITQTLTIKRPGVKLIGDAFDINHDFTPSWPNRVNTAPVSALLWGGANGGTMIRVAPVGNSDNGSGLGGNGVKDLVLFAGTYPFSSAAAYGVTVAGAKGGRYNVFGVEFTIATLAFLTLNRGQPSWENSSQFNIIEYLGSRNSNLGGALKMDGATGQGNAYNNLFHMIDVLHTNGTAIDLFSADNNVFLMTRIQRAAGGTGVGVFFHSADQIDMMARANIFHLLSPGAGGVYSSADQMFPAYENKILFYNPDENGAPLAPVIGTGSTLYWASTKKTGSCTFQAGMSSSQTIPSGVWTKVAFTAAIIDEATWYDTGNARWQPRYPGTYMFTAAVSFTETIGAGSAQMRLIQNAGGSAAFRTARSTLAAGTDSISISAMFGLNGTTDFVEVDVFQDSGADATITVSSDQGYFQGARVG